MGPVTLPEQEYLDGLAKNIAREVLAGMREENDERPLLSARDVARRVGVNERTARGWIESGRLASVKIEGVRRVEPAKLDEFVNAGRQTVDPASESRP